MMVMWEACVSYRISGHGTGWQSVSTSGGTIPRTRWHARLATPEELPAEVLSDFDYVDVPREPNQMPCAFTPGLNKLALSRKPMPPSTKPSGVRSTIARIVDYCWFQVLPLTANARAAPRNRSDTVSSHITSSVTILPAARICCAAPSIACLTFGLSN